MSGSNAETNVRPDDCEPPLLAPPLPLPLVWRYGVPAVAGLGLTFAAFFAVSALTGPTGNKHEPTGEAQNAPAFRFSASDVPGALGTIEKLLTTNSEHVFGALVMPREEKARLKSELERTSMRIGRLVVWDTMDQDDDRIRITTSGFSQDVVIEHTPKSFFVPYLPGTNVNVLALRDGGGGGVTLGVSTALGRLTLPHIAPGQSIEIAVP